MWFEVVIAVLILLYFYVIGLENMRGYDVVKVLIITITAVLVYNVAKMEPIQDN